MRVRCPCVNRDFRIHERESAESCTEQERGEDMKKLVTLSTMFLCLLLLTSCGETTREEQPGRTEPETVTANPITEHMGEHFEQVTAVQMALVRGDLEGIRRPTEWLTAHPAIVGLPEGWSGFVDEMRTAARLTGEAKTFAAAGVATATMVLTCGECHTAVKAEPRVPELGSKGLPPADQVDTVPHMLRHQWAMEQMWVGLINPSEASWRKGAEVLSDAPLEPQKMTDEAELSIGVGELAQRVHELGHDARRTEDWSSRARIYGALLSTCADCHLELGLAIALR